LAARRCFIELGTRDGEVSRVGVYAPFVAGNCCKTDAEPRTNVYDFHVYGRADTTILQALIYASQDSTHSYARANMVHLYTEFFGREPGRCNLERHAARFPEPALSPRWYPLVCAGRGESRLRRANVDDCAAAIRFIRRRFFGRDPRSCANRQISRAEEEKTGSIIENSVVGIVILDPTGGRF